MAETSASSSRGWIVGFSVAAVIVIAVLIARFSFHGQVDVHTATVTYAPLVSTVSTNGKVEPVEDFQAHAPIAGVVEKVYVDVGEQVQRGAELVKMDDSDARSKLASSQAQLDAAEASLKNMQGGGTQDELLSQRADLSAALSQQRQAAAALSSMQALQAKGSASPNEVASAQQRSTDARARVAQLQTRSHDRYGNVDLSAQRSQVVQAQAAVDAARSALAGVDIRAPFAGTVYSVPVSDYDFVQFGEPLLNMADLHQIQVRAYFDEPDIGKLKPGQPVKIVWDAKPGSVWHGHIERVPTTVIKYDVRYVGECIISVNDANGDLLPNVNVTVTVTTAQLDNVLSLPREALRTEGSRNFVYRIVNGKLEKTAVQVGAVNLTRVQIMGGLSDGDSVALNSSGNVNLRDGLAVKALP